MNLSMLDPFAVAREFPETLTQTLSYGHSTCIKTNLKGDYIASGTSDGAIVIIDTDTNSTIKILRDHVRAITSLNWSSCGRYLLSSSRDWKINLWDLQNGKSIRSIIFDGPIWISFLNPLTPFQFVAALVEDQAVFVDWTSDEAIITQLETEPLIINDNVNVNVNDNNNTEENDEVNNNNNNNNNKVTKTVHGNHWTLTACFSPSGKYIVTGTSKGWLNIILSKTLKTVFSMKIANSNIKNITISPMSDKLVINSSDRIIRQYKLPLKFDSIEEENFNFDIELEHKYQDVVNRLQWNSIKLSHNSEYLCASTWGSTHDVYIWETSMGSLVKILEGPNEELIEVDWNYRKCTIGATGVDSGIIYIWGIIFPQKWSALAPDFEEIEENIDYEEKEDEFDIVDEDKLMNLQLEEEDDNKVDILKKENIDARGLPIIESFVIDFNLEELIT